MSVARRQQSRFCKLPANALPARGLSVGRLPKTQIDESPRKGGGMDYQEFLDSVDREAYHEGEWRWREGEYTVTRTNH